MSRPYLVLDVIGRPATFATAHEIPWKEAIRDAVAKSGVEPRPNMCFEVRLDFRTPAPKDGQ